MLSDAARAHIRRFTSIWPILRWGYFGLFYVILGVFRGISAYFGLCGGGRRHHPFFGKKTAGKKKLVADAPPLPRLGNSDGVLPDVPGEDLMVASGRDPQPVDENLVAILGVIGADPIMQVLGTAVDGIEG